MTGPTPVPAPVPTPAPKPFWKSLTFWSVIVLGGLSLGHDALVAAGFPEQAQKLAELVASITGIFGRARAIAPLALR